MRIGIGLILLTDLLVRSLSLKAHYSDEGVLPVAVLKEYNWNAYYFSLHAISGETWFEAVLFILNAVCVICLVTGYRSRLFTFICWAMLVSLQNRNPFILQGGDDLLRLMLFWGIFLPWGHAYTIRPRGMPTFAYFSFANIGYMLLVASVYFFSAMHKTSAEWHGEGSAVYYALSLDQMRLPLGSLLYQFPSVMTALTHIVYWIEVIAPVLLIIPVFTKQARLLGVIALFCLLAGIACSLYVGLFYIIGIVSLIGLLPSGIMDRIDRRFSVSRPPAEQPVQDHPWQGFIRLNVSIYCIVLAVYCLVFNLGQLAWFRYELRDELAGISHLLRLEQNWGMFSPAVLKDDGWFVYEGFTEQHRYINLQNGDSVDFRKPAHVVETYESDRWRKFGENYTFNNNNHMRPYFCRYLIREWNRKHPDNQVTEATIFYMQETSLPAYQVKPVQKIAVCNCQNK